MSGELTHVDPMHASHGFGTRIAFLHWAIEDTQNTVRFLDTKAAFCVTLLSGMVAVSLQRPLTSPVVRHVLFPIFITFVAGSLLVCLRVIFPTIRPRHGSGKPASPKFFIGHNRAHHWILHTLYNPDGDILSETGESYIASLHEAGDTEVLASMAQTVIALAFIRQVKSDRLHSAMFCLGFSIVLFAAIALTAFL